MDAFGRWLVSAAPSMGAARCTAVPPWRRQLLQSTYAVRMPCTVGFNNPRRLSDCWRRRSDRQWTPRCRQAALGQLPGAPAAAASRSRACHQNLQVWRRGDNQLMQHGSATAQPTCSTSLGQAQGRACTTAAAAAAPSPARPTAPALSAPSPAAVPPLSPSSSSQSAPRSTPNIVL